MFHLLNVEARPLTPMLARQFCDMPPSPTERDKNKSRMKMLQAKASDGVLTPFIWMTACLPNGNAVEVVDLDRQLKEANLDQLVSLSTRGVIDLYRMNGQHSSQMLCDLEQIPEGLVAVIEHFRVDNLQDLALLFRQVDDRKSGRSPGDVAGAYQGLVTKLSDVPKATAKLGTEGVAWYMDFIEGVGSGAGDDRYDLMNRSMVQDFLCWLLPLLNTPAVELRLIGVIAAMYGTWLKNSDAASEFWGQVASCALPYDDIAVTVILGQWLRRRHQATLAERQRERIPSKPGIIYNGCIFAWNAFRQGKTPSNIKAGDKKMPPLPIVE